MEDQINFSSSDEGFLFKDNNDIRNILHVKIM